MSGGLPPIEMSRGYQFSAVNRCGRLRVTSKHARKRASDKGSVPCRPKPLFASRAPFLPSSRCRLASKAPTAAPACRLTRSVRLSVLAQEPSPRKPSTKTSAPALCWAQPLARCATTHAFANNTSRAAAPAAAYFPPQGRGIDASGLYTEHDHPCRSLNSQASPPF